MKVNIEIDCSPEEARRIAMLDPESRFFFFCRDGMVLENPEWPEPRIFNPGDAVFFSGEPWWGSAPQCDGYQKDGLSLAYMGNITKTPPLVAGEYATAQGLNAVDVVCLFAANLATSVPYGYVELAPDVPVPAGGTFAIGGDGFPEVFAQSVAPLQAKGLTVLLTLLNNHDQAGWSAFDPDTEVGQSNCANLVAQLKSIVDRYGFDGIDIDYERMPSTSKAAFSAFITLLASKLHADGKKHISKSEVVADCGKGRKFESSSSTGDDKNRNVSKMVICSDPGESDEAWAKTLKDALARVEANTDMRDTGKAQIIADLRSEIAKIGK